MAETAGKKVNRGQFQKGSAGGPGRGKKKPVLLGGDVYADLHDAYTKPSSPTDRPGVLAARKLFVDDYKTFMQLYLKAREERVASDAAADTSGEVGPKEEKLDELLEQLIRGFGT